MEKRFIYFSTKAKFLTATQGTEYDFTSIVFIGDSKEIWNRGIFYGTPVDFDINDYLTKSDAASTYQPKGDYLTQHQSLEGYAKTSEVESKLEGYYTKEEVDSAIEGVDVTDQLTDYVKLEKLVEELAKKADKTEIPSLEGYATESYVDGKIEELGDTYETISGAASKYQPKGEYLTEHQDLSDYAKKSEVTAEIQSEVKKGIDSIVDGASEAMDTLKEVEEALKQSGDTVTALNEAIGKKADKTDIEDMATKTWVNGEGFLKEHQSLEGYAKKSEIPSLEGYLTEQKASETYPSKSEVSEQIAQAVTEGKVDLTGYAKESWVNEQGFLKEHQSLAEYAKKSEVTSEIEEAVEGLSETYYSKSEVDALFDWAEY